MDKEVLKSRNDKRIEIATIASFLGGVGCQVLSFYYEGLKELPAAFALDGGSAMLAILGLELAWMHLVVTSKEKQ